MATSIEFHNNTQTVNELWYTSHRSLLEKALIECDCLDRLDELSSKLLGEQLKIKKLKDPNKPKRAKTSFIFYCNDHRDDIRRKNPDMKLSAVMQELGKSWRSLSAKKKKKYADMHAKDRQRYEDEMDDYENKIAQ